MGTSLLSRRRFLGLAAVAGAALAGAPLLKGSAAPTAAEERPKARYALII
ncbi:MAG: twin-arginine translocation signal domain-containing protein, partial [Anaerolineae bacterium]